MSPIATLVSLATAVPDHVILQPEAAALAARMFEHRTPDYGRLAGVFASAGIRRRYSVRPLDWFAHPRGWEERTAAYLEGAGRLFDAVARKAIAGAGLAPRDVDAIVTVSSTGIATPTLEARAARGLGLRPDVRRIPIFGLGCAGGATGLAVASSLAVAEPGRNVLLVVLELCTLAFRLDKPTKANVVATALFGDGAAACVLRAGAVTGGLARIEGSGEHLWPDTTDIMGWAVDAQGLDVIFSRSIPPFAEARAGAAVDAILQRFGLRARDVDRFACHPGGAKVIMALERGLALEAGTLDHERDVLADYGNMSAPTILFVLERLLAAGLPERVLLSAMGPGFSMSCVSLRRPC